MTAAGKLILTVASVTATAFGGNRAPTDSVDGSGVLPMNADTATTIRDSAAIEHHEPATVAATAGIASSDTLRAAPRSAANIAAPEPVAPPRESARKIKLVKREYDHRQQVVLAVGMMAFILIMMTTAQSWNPK
jgi:hypothetical protein